MKNVSIKVNVKGWPYLFFADNPLRLFLPAISGIAARLNRETDLPPEFTMTVRRIQYSLLCLALAAVCADGVFAENGTSEIAARIDRELMANWQSNQIGPVAEVAADLAIRRLSLDLAGRIPTVAELLAFRSAVDEASRQALIDRLLQSRDFILHQTNEFEAMLLGPQSNQSEFREYLVRAFSENRAWDRMFQDMLVPDPSNTDYLGARQFLLKRAQNLDDMTNDTSRLFFGVSINCAQCHDHPLVADWLQDHYFGMQSFFSRTYVTKKQKLAERFTGEVKFKTTEGEEKRAAFMFLTGTAVTEPELTWSDDDRKKVEEEIKRHQKEDIDAPPPVPGFQPRRQLVELALDAEQNQFFARSIVNRIWARLMGYGLVYPLDQMHSENPSSHPELMQWLAEDLIQSGYNVRRLIRGIVSSRAYFRGSTWSGTAELPSPDTFTVASPRVLSPRQYSLSLLVACGNPGFNPAEVEPEQWSSRRDDWEKKSASLASKLEAPSELFQVSVDEALLFSNSESVQEQFLKKSGDSLVGNLLEGPRDELIVTAFRAVLSREPLSEEQVACEEFLASRTDRHEEGVRQFVWSLLTSPELRFNH